MRNKIKYFLLVGVLLVVALLMVSCGKDSPFKDYDKAGYTVSVKYDANGGTFTTNVATIVDTYNLNSYPTNEQGNKELPLFPPDSPLRGTQQAYTATKDGYYLAGWYASCVALKDAAGNITGYTYDNPWDFENDRLPVNASGEYNSENAVITLYAAWIPLFTFDYEFYVFDENDTPQLVGTKSINPWDSTTLTLPSDNAETGRLMAPNSFPNLDGKTYGKIYLDADKTTEVSDATLNHIGTIDPHTLEVKDRVMKLYCTATDGAKYEITKPEQLTAAADVNAVYILKNDLDFKDRAWPAMFTSNAFNGKIIGNGYTIKNVTITQNNTTNSVFGLFGSISNTASVRDVTFDCVTAKIRGFSNQFNAAFGILAGEIDHDADVSGIVLTNSKLELVKSLPMKVAVNSRSPKFGIVCAVGETTGITYSAEDVTVLFSGTDSTEYTYTPDAKGQFSLSIVEA